MEILKIIEQVKSGDQEALLVLKIIKDFKKEFDGLVKEVEEIALEEAKDYETNFEIHGFKFEKRNGRATYSYKNIPEWVEAKEGLSQIEKNAKSNFSLWKQGKTLIDENGEVMPVPEVKYSNDVLIVKDNNIKK